MTTPSPVASPVHAHKTVRVIAGSAGFGGDPALDDLFASWVGSGKKALYLPFAAGDSDPIIASVQDRLGPTLEAHGVSELVTLTSEDVSSGSYSPDLTDVGAVYMGDGDPTKLGATLHQSGLHAALIDAASRGVALMGTSAGTMMLGADFKASAASITGKRSEMKPEEYQGLGLVTDEHGSQTITLPHFSPVKASMAQRTADTLGMPVLGIRDGNAWVIENGTYSMVGPNPVEWFVPKAATISLPRFARSDRH